MVESRLIIMCEKLAGNLQDKRSLAVFFFERNDCHDEYLKVVRLQRHKRGHRDAAGGDGGHGRTFSVAAGIIFS